MRRNVYIPDEEWRKLEDLMRVLKRPSKSNVICYLVDSYTHYTHTEITGKTPAEINELMDDKTDSFGRESNVAKVATVEGETVSKLKKDLDEIVSSTFRPYSKERQTGRKQK